jgi:voltage-gated potassium channel Kch
LYFSTTTFTTVGYGDVFLDKEWRLLSAFQSANGFIMFGWSTAFIFEIMSKLYKEETLNKTAKKS